MKIYKYISLIVLSLFALASCESDLDKVTFNPDNVVASKLNPLEASYTLSEEKKDEVLDTIRWSATEFGISSAVIYNVEMAAEGNNFKKSIVLTQVTGKTKVAVKHDEVNKKMAELYASMGDTLKDVVTKNMEFRVVTNLGAGITPVTVPSNVVMSTITTFFTKKVEEPQLFMIGTDFGGWNWGDSGVVEMTPVNGSKNTQFWCVRYFKATEGFKWSPVRDWKGDFAKLDTNKGFTEKDGNAFVPADGIYSVFINMDSRSITIEPAKVYGMGEAFGGWDSGTYPFIVNPDGKTMSITTTAAAELRMYATSSAAKSDWWTMEFIILNGKIEYRGNGGDQARVTVAAGQKVTLDFNKGTGTIE